MAAGLIEERGLGTITRLSNLGDGRRHASVAATTSRGQVVIKRHRSDWDLGHVTWEHSILVRLAESHHPATRLIPAQTGRTYSVTGDDCYSVFAFEPGYSLAGSYVMPRTRRRAVEEAGVWLGRLHDTLDGFEPQGTPRLGLIAQDGAPVRAVDSYLAALDRLADGSGSVESNPAEQWLVSVVPQLAQRLADLDRRIEESRGVPTTVVHGDYGLHNLLFRTTDPPLVLDFELARIDHRVVDVMDAAARLPRELAVRFVAAYRTVIPLEPEEVELAPLIWSHHRIRGAVRSWETFSNKGGDRRIETARKRAIDALQGAVPAGVSA